MKIATYTRRDFWIAITLVPVYNLMLNLMLFGKSYYTQLSTFIYCTFITFTLTSLTYQYLHTRVAIWFRNRFPHYRQTPQRIILMLMAHILITNAVIRLLFYGFNYTHFPHFEFHHNRFVWAQFLGALMNTIITCVHEGVYAFELWEQKLQETEKLKKANLQSQLESLKQQVNPHFLFNSLNSLSSLIEDDPLQAEHFLEEMSSVYRYLLRSTDTELTSLTTELEFTSSYFHLLSTRYGNGLKLHQKIESRYQNCLLPPLTLQLLLENVVKHNVILPEQPLLIEIITNEAGHLIVRNNLQRKTSRVASNRVGLANIAAKYRLLGKGEVVVQDDEQYFTVTLPLIQHE